MPPRRSDNRTLNLLDWQPPRPIPAYPEEKVRAATIGARISKAVSLSLSEAKDGGTKLEREDIARRMADYLGEDVSSNMLNAYASESRDAHNISVIRAVAMMIATGDYRLFNLMAEHLGLTVIDKKYETVVEEAQTAELIEELQQRLGDLRRRRKQ
ncbi:MAG TPA: DNA transposition protein [Rhodospirillaceae bacterium]|nr:DNA transposition protein [Magnetovibrio sp.]HBT44345.1 DNA transposition protein [Rhodospirillaceae bacterium]HCS70051.1 DNA transposition protein [Rhodospirillaceae bacterium]|tara:strand:- start:101 stop:568 length:468 start_codon:yes stop_codon:yes gene_type:complete